MSTRGGIVPSRMSHANTSTASRHGGPRLAGASPHPTDPAAHGDSPPRCRPPMRRTSRTARPAAWPARLGHPRPLIPSSFIKPTTSCHGVPCLAREPPPCRPATHGDTPPRCRPPMRLTAPAARPAAWPSRLGHPRPLRTSPFIKPTTSCHGVPCLARASTHPADPLSIVTARRGAGPQCAVLRGRRGERLGQPVWDNHGR